MCLPQNWGSVGSILPKSLAATSKVGEPWRITEATGATGHCFDVNRPGAWDASVLEEDDAEEANKDTVPSPVLAVLLKGWGKIWKILMKRFIFGRFGKRLFDILLTALWPESPPVGQTYTWIFRGFFMEPQTNPRFWDVDQPEHRVLMGSLNLHKAYTGLWSIKLLRVWYVRNHQAWQWCERTMGSKFYENDWPTKADDVSSSRDPWTWVPEPGKFYRVWWDDGDHPAARDQPNDWL